MYRVRAASEQARAAYACPTAWSQFKQPVTEGAGVRQAKIRAVFGQKLSKAGIVSKDIDWSGFDLGEHALVKVLDLKRHR